MVAVILCFGGVLPPLKAVQAFFFCKPSITERNRQGCRFSPTPIYLRPAEEVALEKLDGIKEEKIWQAGQVKEYHTQLTDVIREYISRRFGVSSTEQTSDETLRAMKPLLAEQKDIYEHLRKMLTLADLVKFAKWTATPDENEQSLRNAYEFVRETTPVAAAEDDKQQKEKEV